MKVTILGCGSAAGVPSVSAGWGACDPGNPKNRRRRSSILIEEGPTRLLVDTSPDIRQQLLDADTRVLDAVIYTHDHADHIQGLDELREINRFTRKPLAVCGPADTLALLQHRFDYAFKGIPPGAPFFRPWLVPTALEPGAAFEIGGIRIVPFLQDHGLGATSMGYRFGDAVYSTDVLDLPAAAREVIRGAKLWVVGAFALEPHPTHAHVAKVLEWAAELSPKRAVITHMSGAIDFAALKTTLPPNIEPAYDGLVLEV